MTISIASFDRDAKAIDVAEALRRDGAAIVRELVAPDVMDSLTSKLATELDAQEPGGGSFFGHRMKILTRLFARGPEFAEHLMLNQRVLEVTDAILRPQFPMAAPSQEKPIATADASDTPLEQLFGSRDPVLGPHCHHYRVNVGVALQVCGGGKNQPLHREMDIYRPFLEHDPERHECILAVNWAGTDFTRDNGATRLALGSHRWPQEREAENHEVAQAVMPKGSAIFWLGKALHGLGANRVDEPRTGILFTFTLNWLAQEENQYLAVPPEIARTLPERAQPLLGYRASPILGHVGGRDNENLLNEGKIGSRY